MTIIPFNSGKKNNKKLYAVTGAKYPKEAIKAVLRYKKESQGNFSKFEWNYGKIRRTNKTIELYKDLSVKGTDVFIVWRR